MRTLAFLALVVAGLQHQIAVNAGHPEAKVVTLEEERKLATQPLDETIVWCDTVAGQLACSVEVGAHGEWTAEEFLPNLNGVTGKSVGSAWWLPEARTLNPIHQNSEAVAPRLISRTEPKYTETARKARVSGIVIVETIIDKTGRVVAARIVKALPFGLNEEAVNCVKAWRFRPATLHGHAIDVFFNLTVNFRLDSAANGGKK